MSALRSSPRLQRTLQLLLFAAVMQDAPGGNREDGEHDGGEEQQLERALEAWG